MYAGIYTLVPYLLAFPSFIVSGTFEGGLFFAILVWIPFLLVGSVINFLYGEVLSNPYNDWVNDHLTTNFGYYGFPIISFLIWYVITCHIAFLPRIGNSIITLVVFSFFTVCALFIPLFHALDFITKLSQ